LAARRGRSVVQGDVAGLPFNGGVASRVVSVLTLTDFDDVGPFFVEAHRVLAPGGKLVVISTHPCFVGPFVKMEGGAEGVAAVYPGYRVTERVFAGPGIGSGVRSRVGVRHVPLSELLNKLLASKLQVEHIEELGNGTVPWLLTLIASKAHV
jgi:SAM-dependent methyltransferase